MGSLKKGIIATASLIGHWWVWRAVAQSDGIITIKERVVLYSVFAIVAAGAFLIMKDAITRQ